MSAYALTTQICPEMFSPDAWREQVQPLFHGLGNDGGCVCITLESDPKFQNFPTIKIHSFDTTERKVIRQAIARCRQRATKALAPAQHAAPVTSATAANPCHPNP